MSITAVANEVLSLLNSQLPAFLGPAEQLPTRDGSVEQSAVLWFTSGNERYRAESAHRLDRVESFRVVAVGKNQLECLAATEKVRRALHGQHLTTTGPGGGRVFESGFNNVEPSAEPGTDPIRVSLSIEFKTVTKEQ